VDGADHLAAVDALEVDAGDPEVGVSELALDYDEWDTLVRHLDRVGMPKLMRRKTPPHPRRCGGMVQLLARG
jgi:hypothetical protein